MSWYLFFCLLTFIWNGIFHDLKEKCGIYLRASFCLRFIASANKNVYFLLKILLGHDACSVPQFLDLGIFPVIVRSMIITKAFILGKSLCFNISSAIHSICIFEMKDQKLHLVCTVELWIYFCETPNIAFFISCCIYWSNWQNFEMF